MSRRVRVSTTVLVLLGVAVIAAFHMALVSLMQREATQGLLAPADSSLAAALVFAANCWNCFHWVHSTVLAARGTGSRLAERSLKRLSLWSVPILFAAAWAPALILLFCCCSIQWAAINYWIEATRRKRRQSNLLISLPFIGVALYGILGLWFLFSPEDIIIDTPLVMGPFALVLMAHWWICMRTLRRVSKW